MLYSKKDFLHDILVMLSSCAKETELLFDNWRRSSDCGFGWMRASELWGEG